MEIFIRTLLILLAVGLISFLAIKENKKYSGSNTIRLPKTYFWVGIVCVVFFFILFILLVTSPEKSIDWINSFIVSSVFLITSIAIITAYLNWQIEILNNKIIYRTFFRKKHEYEFNELWIKKHTKNIIIVVAKKQKLYIDPYAVGIEKFINIINKNKMKKTK